MLCKSYSDFLAYQKGQSKQVSANVYDSTIATADGQYELIKSQLGNYPDNLLLDNPKLSNIINTSSIRLMLFRSGINFFRSLALI